MAPAHTPQTGLPEETNCFKGYNKPYLSIKIPFVVLSPPGIIKAFKDYN